MMDVIQGDLPVGNTEDQQVIRGDTNIVSSLNAPLAPREQVFLSGAPGSRSDVLLQATRNIEFSMEAGMGVPPEQMRRAKRVSQELQINPEIVNADPEFFNRLKEAQNIISIISETDDQGNLKHPLTAQVFVDPEAASVFDSEVRARLLMEMEDVLNYEEWGSIGRAGIRFAEGLKQEVPTFLSLAGAFAETSSDTFGIYRRLFGEAPGKRVNDFIRGSVINSDFFRRKAMPDDGILMGIASMAPNRLRQILTFKFGGAAWGTAGMAGGIFGDAYGEYRGMGLDHDSAGAIAALNAAVQTPIQAAAMLKFMGVFGKVGTAPFTKVLADYGMAALDQYGAEFGAKLLADYPSRLLAEAKAAGRDPLEYIRENFSAVDVLEESHQVGMMSFYATLLFGAFGLGGAYSLESHRARQATLASNLGEWAQKAKAEGLTPDMVEKVVGDMLHSNNMRQDVTLPNTIVEEFFQDENLRSQVAEYSPPLMAQLQEAFDNHTDATISAEAYAANFAGTALASVDKVVFTPDGATAKDIENLKEVLGKSVDELGVELEVQAEETLRVQEEVQRLRTSLAEATGRPLNQVDEDLKVFGIMVEGMRRGLKDADSRMNSDFLSRIEVTPDGRLVHDVGAMEISSENLERIIVDGNREGVEAFVRRLDQRLDEIGQELTTIQEGKIRKPGKNEKTPEKQALRLAFQEAEEQFALEHKAYAIRLLKDKVTGKTKFPKTGIKKDPQILQNEIRDLINQYNAEFVVSDLGTADMDRLNTEVEAEVLDFVRDGVTVAQAEGFKAQYIQDRVKAGVSTDALTQEADWISGLMDRAQKWTEQQKQDTPFQSAAPLVALQGLIDQAPTMEAKQAALDAWKADPANAELVKAAELRVKEAAVRAGFNTPKLYHGTGARFRSFDKTKRGYATQAQSARRAFFFVDDKASARSYAVYAAETGPVTDLIRQANAAEARGDWDAYESLIEQAEALDTSDATMARREDARVAEVFLAGDFYEVDAEGKTPQELSQDGDIDSWLDNQVSEAKKAGKTGVLIRGLDDTVGRVDVPADHYVVFDPTQIKSAEAFTLDADGGIIPLSERFDTGTDDIYYQGQRAQTAITDDMRAVVTLFENQDASSFLHEGMHIWTSFAKKLIDNGEMNDAFVKDFNAMIEWAAKQEGADTWAKQHEILAEAFEAYLMEGKAPTVELASTFSRIKEWLVAVYKGLPVGVPLDDEIRGLFNRIMATEDEIAQAEAYYGLVESYSDLYEVAEEDRAKLRQKREKSQSTARDSYLKRLTAHWKKDQGGIEGLREIATNQLKATPVYASLEAAAVDKVAPEAVADVLGEGAVEAVAAHEVLAKPGSRDGADVVIPAAKLSNLAFENGFESTQSMLEAWATTPPIQEAAQAEANRMEQEQFNKFADTTDNIPGDEDVHSDERLDYLTAEYNELQKKLNKPALSKPLTARAAREAARGILDGLLGRNARSYKKYSQAEARYAKQTVLALKKGDFEAADKSMQQQILHHALVIEAVEIREEMDKMRRKYLKIPLNKRLSSENIGTDVSGPLQKMLRRYGFLEDPRGTEDFSEPLAIPIPEGELAHFLPDLRDITPAWIENLTIPGGYRNFSDLTVSQIRELHDTIESWFKYGRREIDALKGAFGETVDEYVSSLAEKMRARPDKERATDQTMMGRFLNAIQKGGAVSQMMTFFTDRMDNYQWAKTGEHGPMGALFREASRVENLYETQLTDKWKQLEPFMKVLTDAKKRMPALFSVEGFPMPEMIRKRHGRQLWDFQQSLCIVLNMGTEAGRYALEHGFQVSEGATNAMASLFTSAEWDAVQGVWDALNEMFKPLDDVQHKLTRKRMVKEEAVPFYVQTADGETKLIRGGYLPLVYDSAIDPKAAEYSETDDLMRKGGIYKPQPGTKKGMTISRLKGEDGSPVVEKAIVLDPARVLGEHISDVTRRITHTELIREVDAITRSRDFAETFKDKFGIEMYESFRDWLGYLARPERRVHGSFDRTMNSVRAISTAAILAYRVPTSLKQRLSLFSAVSELGAGYIAKGVMGTGIRSNVYGGLTETTSWINKTSAYMSHRAHNFDREKRDMVRGFRPFSGSITVMGHEMTHADMQEWGWAMIKANDMATAYTVWWGAYQKGLDTLKADTAEALEQKAIEYADEIVERTNPSARPMDLAKVQRDEGYLRLFTMFSTWMLKAGNRFADERIKLREGVITRPEYIRHIILEGIAPTLPPLLLASMLYNEEKEPEWWEYLVGGPEYMVGTIPFIGRAVTGSIRYGAGFGETPAFQVLDNALSTGRFIGGAILEGDGEATGESLMGMARILGQVSGVPVINVLDDYKKFMRNTTEE